MSIQEKLKTKFKQLCEFFDLPYDAVEVQIEENTLRGIYIYVSSKDEQILSKFIGRNGRKARAFRNMLRFWGNLNNLTVFYFIRPTKTE